MRKFFTGISSKKNAQSVAMQIEKLAEAQVEKPVEEQVKKPEEKPEEKPAETKPNISLLKRLSTEEIIAARKSLILSHESSDVKKRLEEVLKNNFLNLSLRNQKQEIFIERCDALLETKLQELRKEKPKESLKEEAIESAEEIAKELADTEKKITKEERAEILSQVRLEILSDEKIVKLFNAILNKNLDPAPSNLEFLAEDDEKNWDKLTNPPELPSILTSNIWAKNNRINDYIEKQLSDPDKSTQRLMVTSLANAYSPGGFPWSHMAQEEAIMIITDALLRMPAFYPNTKEDSGLSRMSYAYHIKNIQQYKFDENDKLVSTSPFDMVFVAAPDFAVDKNKAAARATHANSKEGRKEYLRYMAYMMRLQYEHALKAGSTKLVSGALDCGAFGNNPFLVAAIFKCVSEEEKYNNIDTDFVIAYDPNPNRAGNNLPAIFNYIFRKADRSTLELILKYAKPSDPSLGNIKTDEQITTYIDKLKKQEQQKLAAKALTIKGSNIIKPVASLGITSVIAQAIKKLINSDKDIFLKLNKDSGLKIGFPSEQAYQEFAIQYAKHIKNHSDRHTPMSISLEKLEIVEDKGTYGKFVAYVDIKYDLVNRVLQDVVGILPINIAEFKRVNNIVDEDFLKYLQDMLPQYKLEASIIETTTIDNRAVKAFKLTITDAQGKRWEPAVIERANDVIKYIEDVAKQANQNRAIIK